MINTSSTLICITRNAFIESAIESTDFCDFYHWRPDSIATHMLHWMTADCKHFLVIIYTINALNDCSVSRDHSCNIRNRNIGACVYHSFWHWSCIFICADAPAKLSACVRCAWMNGWMARAHIRRADVYVHDVRPTVGVRPRFHFQCSLARELWLILIVAVLVKRNADAEHVHFVLFGLQFFFMLLLFWIRELLDKILNSLINAEHFSEYRIGWIWIHVLYWGKFEICYQIKCFVAKNTRKSFKYSINVCYRMWMSTGSCLLCNFAFAARKLHYITFELNRISI